MPRWLSAVVAFPVVFLVAVSAYRWHQGTFVAYFIPTDPRFGGDPAPALWALFYAIAAVFIVCGGILLCTRPDRS